MDLNYWWILCVSINCFVFQSSDSTASGADREKQRFDFYVQPGYKPKPHYVQPKYEPEPPKEYKPEPPKPEYEPEPTKEYGKYGDHKNVVLIDGSLNKVDLNSGVRVALR